MEKKREIKTETNLNRINVLRKSYEHVRDQASVSQNTSAFSTSKFAINQSTSVRQIICNVPTALNSRIFALHDENVLRLRPVAR